MWKRQLILAVLWLAAVGWYWREYVPLRPTRSVPLRYESTFVGWTPENDALISRVRLDSTRQYVKHCGGPISVWRVPELEKVSERLGYGDEIGPGNIDPKSAIAVVGLGSTKHVVDLTTGIALEEVPSDVLEVILRPGAEGHLLYLRRDSVALRDPRSSRDIWKVQGINAGHGHFQGDLVVLHNVDFLAGVQGIAATTRRSCLPLNSTTGEVDTRFDPIGPFSSVVISEDQRWAIVGLAFGLSQICDAKTGRRLWPLNVKSESWPQFDPHKDEVVLYWATPSGELRESRWRCSDGSNLSPPPPPFSRWANRRIDAAGRYAIESTVTRGPYNEFCAGFLNPTLKSLGSKTTFPTEQSIRKLRDLSTDRIVGPLPDNPVVEFVPDHSALIVVDGDRISLIELPAARDWSWLAWYGVLPVGLAWSARELWRRSSRRRRAGPSSEEPHSTPSERHSPPAG